MKLLAIETATRMAGVAAWADGRVLAERRQTVTTHSEQLMVMVDEALREAGWAARDLDALVCGAGPGSFTGLRIGLATAKGLSFALGRPLALVSSLETLAARVPDGRVGAVLDAYKGEVYAGLYDVTAGVPRALVEEQAWPPARLAEELAKHAPIVLVGDGAIRYPSLVALLSGGARLYDEDGAPRPGDLARLGALRLAEGADDRLAGPRYLRPSEAELFKEKKNKN